LAEVKDIMDVGNGLLNSKSQEQFRTVKMEPGNLDFEAPQALIEKRPDSSASLKPLAAGGSVLITFVALFLAWGVTQKLNRKTNLALPHTAWQRVTTVHWNFLSLLVLCFLGLNVLFGLLTAFLVTDGGSASDEYFENLTAFKLAKLSHQHFFGYGLLYGILALLTLCFVGAQKKTLFPLLIGFFFTALDFSSLWMSKYVSTGFHLLSVFSGSLFSLAFLWLCFLTARANIRAIQEAN
jgi:hypothetical protein